MGGRGYQQVGADLLDQHDEEAGMCVDPSATTGGFAPYGNQAFATDNLGGDTSALASAPGPASIGVLAADQPFCEAPGENYPYSDDTFDTIREMSPEILAYAEQYGVPPAAVAGAIADEYNTRTGLKGALDWFQDEVLLNWMPNSWIAFDDAMGFDSKLLNANKHDLGKGNIKLETAMDLLERYPDDFPADMEYASMVDFLNTDAGTAQVAAMVMRDARVALDPYLEGYSDAEREAVYITYYKQGPSYVERFEQTLAEDPTHQISPGEGCGTYLQRERMLEALGPDQAPIENPTTEP